MLKPRYFPFQYRMVLEEVLQSPKTVNARTGKEVRTAAPIAFRLIAGPIPQPGNRRVYPKTAAAELAWFISGSRSTAWMRKYTQIWEPFVDENDLVPNAYGYRWRQHFGRDQLIMAVEALRQDRSTRQIWVTAWDPRCDGLGDPESPRRNVACPIGWSISARDTLLDMSVFLRSSDVFMGLPYDVMGHALLLDALAHELDLVPGVLMMSLANPHIYERHVNMALESLRGDVYEHEPSPPNWSLSEIAEDPDGYVQHVAERTSHIAHPLVLRPAIVL